MNLKRTIKRAIPKWILNKILLTFPIIYSLKFVNYETNMSVEAISELLKQLSLALELEGNIIECGSSRCGASVIIAKYLQSNRTKKLIYACDSFEGFDQNELHKEKDAGLTNTPDNSFTSTSIIYVKSKITALGVDSIVIPIKGYFKDTLPNIDSKFCFALVDCDLRESMVFCAEAIWPSLVSGGQILFDDYTDNDFMGARLAIDQFIDKYRNEIQEHRLLSRLYSVVKK